MVEYPSLHLQGLVSFCRSPPVPYVAVQLAFLVQVSHVLYDHLHHNSVELDQSLQAGLDDGTTAPLLTNSAPLTEYLQVHSHQRVPVSLLPFLEVEAEQNKSIVGSPLPFFILVPLPPGVLWTPVVLALEPQFDDPLELVDMARILVVEEGSFVVAEVELEASIVEDLELLDDELIGMVSSVAALSSGDRRRFGQLLVSILDVFFQ